MSVKDRDNGQPGVGVDSRGGAVIDPTENVIALTKAAVQRIDDLSGVRQELVDEKIKRVLREMKWQDKTAILRAEHSRELRYMEADRVDKIRSVDVANAAATAQQLLNAVNTLSTTAQTTAEVLRNQVAATATAVASQTERALNPILDRIALLEKSSYTGAGKGVGFSTSWMVLLGAVALIATLIGLFLRPQVQPAAPQVIYVPTAPVAGK